MRFPIGDGIPWRGTKTLYDGTGDSTPDGIVRYITVMARAVSSVGTLVASVDLTVNGLSTNLVLYTFGAVDPASEIPLLERVPFSGPLLVTATGGTALMLYGYIEYDAAEPPVTANPLVKSIPLVDPLVSYINQVYSATATPQIINVGVEGMQSNITLNVDSEPDTITLYFSSANVSTAADIAAAAIAADTEFVLNLATVNIFRLLNNLPMLGANIAAVSAGAAAITTIYGSKQS